MSVTGITMFRARDGVQDLDELIPERGELPFEDFQLNDGSIALVYYQQRPLHPPRWARFFSGIVGDDVLRSASTSAVVVFQRGGRWYLVTFGYGRSLINLDLVEPSFGLKTTLNAIDPEKIRSIDRKRVDAVSRLTREQLSRDSRIGSFGLDVHRDLLSAVTGVPTVAGLGSRMYGKDAVGLRIDVTPTQLGDVADMLEELYQDQAYRAHFPWVENISEVSGAREIAKLDKKLVSMLKEGGDQEFDLAPPELLDWGAALGFEYKRGADPEGELKLEKYYELVRSLDDVTVETLRKDRVGLVDQDGNRLAGWSVYRCLSGQLGAEDARYVISDGKWYRVDQDFAIEVDEAVEALDQKVLDLPPYSAQDDNEASYLVRVAQESEGDLLCLDQQFVWPRSWQDRIEFCDLYRTDRTLIHVKRYSGGSAALSHLFAQGGVSLRCLLTDRAFVKDVDDRLLGSTFGGEAPHPESCHVVYAIVEEPDKELRLPFFSRVALRNAADLIRGFGASVSFQAIGHDTQT